MNSVRRFSEFATDDKPLEGDKKRIDDVVNLEVTITGARVRESKYKEETGRKWYMTLQFELEEGDRKNVLFTGSEVLIGQIEKYQEYLPFATKIQKIDRYYTFT